MGAVDTCAECGFRDGDLHRASLAPAFGDRGRQLVALLSGPIADPAQRRRPEQWSPLEYACHVRDVLLVQRDRPFVALVEDELSCKPMYRDQRVAFDRYDDQPIEIVTAQLLMAAAMAAHAFAGLTDEQWERPLVDGHPEPTSRDVEWMAQHTAHEMVHHHGDIERLVG